MRSKRGGGKYPDKIETAAQNEFLLKKIMRSIFQCIESKSCPTSPLYSNASKPLVLLFEFKLEK